MKLLIALNHPSQYYLFRLFSLEMRKRSHEVRFAINNKDILRDLLLADNQIFEELSIKKGGVGTISILGNRILELVKQDFAMYSLVNRFMPDYLIGTDISITHIGKLKGIPSFVFNEDDYNVNILFCKAAYPLASRIISPIICNVDHFTDKKIGYNGYQKLAYLHPNRFTPDFSIVSKYIPVDKPFFILRLVSFAAGHDVEKKHSGISEYLLYKIIDRLKVEGNVYITSEKELPEGLGKYLLKINPLDIHHFLYYATLFIGDSQSMCVESSILGTCALRFNSFVGKISVLEELEHKYELTFGVKPEDQRRIFEKLEELLSYSNLKGIFQARRQKMLSDKIDVTAFMVWFVENYPESVKVMKANPDYQNRFKTIC